LGLACNFEQAGVQLPWPIFRSQPHFPNYRLGPVGDEGLPCTPIVSVQETELPVYGVDIFPNPASDEMTLSPQGISGEWLLYDGFGRTILRKNIENNQPLKVSVEALPKGLYYWNMEGSYLSGKIVVQ